MKPAENKILSELSGSNGHVFENLFRQYYDDLCNYACSIIQNPDESEEVVQDVFLNLWDKRQKNNIHTSIKAYLYTSVRNHCLNRIKHQNVRHDYNDKLSYEKNTVTGSDDASVKLAEKGLIILLTTLAQYIIQQ